MFGNRLRYLLILAGLTAYYIANGEWLSWILLVCALIFPWLSLLISLPAIRKFHLQPTGNDALEIGEPGKLWLMGRCSMPLPPFRGSIQLTDTFTGKRQPYRPERGFPTDHCGSFTASVRKPRVCDYLGLFSFPVRDTQAYTVVIRPKPLPMEQPPKPECRTAIRWKPKPGGGFSENHELRPYRPGDELKLVHWKLSSKAGSLILREPMVPVRGKTLLTLVLPADADERDRLLGRFLWLGRHFLSGNTVFELRALTGSGMLALAIDAEPSLLKALDTLLLSPPAPRDAVMEDFSDAEWQYRIGGDADAS